MLKWISSRLKTAEVPAHPLGSSAGIESYLESVPRNDPQRVLLELGEWLGDAEHLASQLGEEAFLRAVMALDEFARPSVKACWELLLRELRESGSALRVATVLQDFLAGVHGCNRKALQLLRAQGDKADRQQVATLLLRAVVAWIEAKRIRVVHYREVEASWWQEMHALLRYAQEHDVVREALRAYPADRARTSVWQEYFTTLLFEGGPLGGLNPDEIDIVERLARWIEPHAQFVEQPLASTPYCILPADDHRPERRREHASYDPRTRFYGAGNGRGQLLQLGLQLARDGKLPEWLQGSGCTVERLRHLIDVLVEHWSAAAPTRRYRRHRVRGMLHVVHGLDLIRRMVAATEFAQSGRKLDYDGFVHEMRTRALSADMPKEIPPPPKTPMDVLRLLESAGVRQMMDTWELVDVSSQGMGVQFMLRRPWMRIGSLVGYRWDEELEWRIGVIRRLGQHDGKPSAGLTLFEGAPRCSQIRHVGAEAGGGVWHQQTRETSGLGWADAILLRSGTNQLLVPVGRFEKGQAVQVSLDGKWRTARVAAVTPGEEYELLEFELPAA